LQINQSCLKKSSNLDLKFLMTILIELENVSPAALVTSHDAPW